MDLIIHFGDFFVLLSLFIFGGCEVVPALLHLPLEAMRLVLKYFNTPAGLCQLSSRIISLCISFHCFMHLVIKVLLRVHEPFRGVFRFIEQKVGHFDHLLHLFLTPGYFLKGHSHFVLQVEVLILLTVH